MPCTVTPFYYYYITVPHHGVLGTREGLHSSIIYYKRCRKHYRGSRTLRLALLHEPLLFYTLHVTPSRSFARRCARRGSAAPSVSTSSPPGSTAATLRARRYSRCPAYSSRAFVCAGSARCNDFLAATVTATLATTALATDTALSVTIVLPQDVQLHVLVYRPRCSACEGRGVRGLQDARGMVGDVHTHGMVGHRSQLFVSHTVAFYLY